MNAYFDIGQKALATRKRIVKVYEIPKTKALNGEKYLKYTMPADFYGLSRLWVDEEVASGVWQGKRLILPAEETRKVEVEYYAYPTTITGATADDYEFEIEQDAQECLPFFVAAQHLVTDLVVDSSRILRIYEELAANLRDTLPPNPIRVVTVGRSYGGGN